MLKNFKMIILVTFDIKLEKRMDGWKDRRTDKHKSGRTFYHNSATLTNEHVETCNKEL